MNFELIETALDNYFANHFYEKTDKLALNLFYPIKGFQKDKHLYAYPYSYYESKVTIYPSLEVISIVVSPKESHP